MAIQGGIDPAEGLETRRRPSNPDQHQSPERWDRSMIVAGRFATWYYRYLVLPPAWFGSTLTWAPPFPLAFPFAFSFAFPLTLSFPLDLSCIRFEHSSPPVLIGTIHEVYQDLPPLADYQSLKPHDKSGRVDLQRRVIVLWARRVKEMGPQSTSCNTGWRCRQLGRVAEEIRNRRPALDLTQELFAGQEAPHDHS